VATPYLLVPLHTDQLYEPLDRWVIVWPKILYWELTGGVVSSDGCGGAGVLAVAPAVSLDGEVADDMWLSDEDIPSIDTPAVPTAEHIQGPITPARAKQFNYQVLSFLGTLSHIHENMMLPKSDMFVTLRNDGPSMDERDKHWSMIVHGDGSKRLRIEEDATSGDFRTLKPP
jgi:hypothetical protein